MNRVIHGVLACLRSAPRSGVNRRKSRSVSSSLTIPAYATEFIDDSHFVTFSLNADDEAQIEIWEMKLRPSGASCPPP